VIRAESPRDASMFIGRSDVLAALVDALGEALAGTSAVVLLEGEAGIGKTRLLEELERLAAARLVPVVWGRASSVEGAPPFWLWQQVLRDDGLRARGGDVAPLDELLGILAAGASGTDGPASIDDRFLLFERVADALVTAAEPRGTVILLDDLQWADAASLLLLQHVVTHRRRARMMIGATIRSGEPSGATVGAALQHVGRSSSTRRFDLAGFDRAAVAAQLVALGHDPTADEVEAVAHRTGGNPLFVREMGRLVQPGEALTLDRVPDAVRVVLAQRIAPVPPTSRRTIAIASVVGTDVDVDLVRAIAGRSAEELLDDLAEAEHAGILHARPRGTVPRFVHDLMREALQDELSARELAAIHLAIAAELDRRGGHEAAIAHHRLAALPLGDPRSAIEATLAAARAAMTRLAFEDAAALFGRGLASSAASTLSAAEQCGALVDQGTSLLHAHDLEAAIDVCARAATLARASADVTGLARAALALQDVSEPRWLAQIDPWLTEALDALPPDDSSMRAQLLATLSVSRVLQELPGGTRRASRRQRWPRASTTWPRCCPRTTAGSWRCRARTTLKTGSSSASGCWTSARRGVSTRRWCGAISGGSTRCSSSDG